MDPKSCLAAVLLLVATWTPLLSKRPAAPPLPCSDRSLLERIDADAIRGGLAVVVCPGAACAGCSVREARGGARLLLGRPIDLDDATAEELRALPGIGPGRARRLVEARERLGGFGSFARLRQVEGLGPKRIAALAGWARAGPGREASPGDGL